MASGSGCAADCEESVLLDIVMSTFGSDCGLNEVGQYEVSFSMTAAGDVSDYTSSKQSLMRIDIANQLSGVSSSDIDLKITSASVNIEVTITTSSQSAANSIEGTMSSVLATPSTASAMFASAGVSVYSITSYPTVTEVTEEEETAMGGIIGGAVGGAAALGLLLIVVAVCCCKKKKKAAPPAAAAPQMVAQGSAVEAVPMGQPVAYPDVQGI